ncbi:hypothetical protein DFJ73DRAFT_846089 [Zopfochytrium polystomum]|nr:hypothetical protein DFJ73DRAFT_846089 [Zopfochytrium polystomum]
MLVVLLLLLLQQHQRARVGGCRRRAYGRRWRRQLRLPRPLGGRVSLVCVHHESRPRRDVQGKRALFAERVACVRRGGERRGNVRDTGKER